MRVLAVVAHPDDESFFIGGTLVQHALNGDKVSVVALSDGEGSRFEEECVELSKAIAKRGAEFQQACQHLRVNGGWSLTFPDQQADTVPQLAINRRVEALIAQFTPELVYTHHVGDLNLDHRRVAEAVLVATRAGALVRCMSPEWPARCVGPAFVPTFHVGLSPLSIQLKLKACESYDGEVREYPHPRSTRAVREQWFERFMEVE
jgi:LmbE family N-acetylglucosaminyl deacetylase